MPHARRIPLPSSEARPGGGRTRPLDRLSGRPARDGRRPRVGPRRGRGDGERVGQVAIVAGVLGAARAVLTLPLGWTRGWWLPRRYGLLHQEVRGWLADRAKAALLSGALGLAAVEVVYALLRATPLWWLWAAAAFLAANVALAFVFPVWIAPLFYRLTPLADAGLSERPRAPARRAGVPAAGV